MNEQNLYPTMPGCSAKGSDVQNGSCRCSTPRSRSSGADEFDNPRCTMQRSEYSYQSSCAYDNWSVLDEVDKKSLMALRKKACNFIMDQEEAPAKGSPCNYISGCEPQFVCPALVKKANDIDYVPESEFLRKMKQQCQFLASNRPNLFNAIDEGIVNDADEVENFLIQSSINAGERVPGPIEQGRTTIDEAGMQQNFDYSYEEPVNMERNDRTYILEGGHPSDQNVRQSRSTQKKSEHISRSKKPQMYRGRRKRKSGSGGEEEGVPKGAFESTLKRPHENSCERCWRYASPARSPVNKPEQKYDPNFRRGHSCYNFERGDADQDVSDRHISPCRNLQPITSRDRAESVTPPSSRIRKTPPGSVQKTPPPGSVQKTPPPGSVQKTPSGPNQKAPPPGSVQKTPSGPTQKTPPMKYTPENEIPSYSYNAPLPNFLQGTPHPRAKQGVSIWERPSVEPYYRQQPLNMDLSPDPVFQQRISEMHPSPHPSFQQRSPRIHQSPFQQESVAAEPQPVCQRVHFSPQQTRQKTQVQFRTGNDTTLSYYDSSPECSPERTRVVRSPFYDYHPDPNCPLARPQSVRTTPKSFRNVPENLPDNPPTEMQQFSNFVEDMNATQYRTFTKPRERSFEAPERYPQPLPPESVAVCHDLDETEYQSISRGKSYDTVGSRSVPLESVEVGSPRQVSRPSTALGTIPEGSDSDSNKNRSGKESGSPKKVKSPKNTSKQSVRSPRRSSGGSREISRQSLGSPKKSTPSKAHTPSKSGSPKQGKPKSPSPKPSLEKGRSEGGKSPKKSPSDSKRPISAPDVNVTYTRTPEQRPRSPEPRVQESTPVRIPLQEPVKSLPKYDRPDHLFQKCPCKPRLSISLDPDYQPSHLICCHCNWQERLKNQANQPGPSKNLNEENPKGYDSMAYRCPYLVKNGKANNSNSSEPFGEAEIRLMRDQRKEISYENLSPIPHTPKKYFVFYMTKCKENKGDDDVEVLVEEFTQACPEKSDLRTKDITERMKKIMECPSDSMALRFQKGVSEPCKVPQSSRVLYF